MLIIKRFLFTVLILCFLFQVNAQVIHRNILHKYGRSVVNNNLIPRSSWNPFPHSPEEWKQKIPDSIINKLITYADSVKEIPFRAISASSALVYKRIGSRRMDSELSEKRSNLFALVVGESVEGKGRYIEAIMNGIWSVCEESFWGLSAHLTLQKNGIGLPDVSEPTVDLTAAETASMLAVSDYLIGDKLDKVTPLIRKRIFYEVKRRVLTPMETGNYWYLGKGNPNYRPNNWNPWIMSNCLTANLLLEPDETLRKKNTLLYMDYADKYINGLGEDGGCEEGPGYWSGAVGCVFDILSLLNDATGKNLTISKMPLFQKMASYIYKMHIAGKNFVDIADGQPQVIPDGLFLHRIGIEVGDKNLAGFGGWGFQNFGVDVRYIFGGMRSRAIFNLMNYKACAAYPAALPNLPHTFISDIQVMCARTEDGLFVGTHGGNNGESHNHNDVGDFIIYANGYPAIIDVGAGTYTAKTFSNKRYDLWFNTSSYHNLPTINGIEQKDGSNFKATKVEYLPTDSVTSLKLDIATAYPKDAGIVSWIRTVSAYKKSSIEVSDNYILSNAPTSITQSLMTVCPTDINEIGKISFKLPDNKQVVLNYNPDQWTVSKEMVSLDLPESQAFKNSWHHQSIWRILLTNKEKKQSGIINYKIVWND